MKELRQGLRSRVFVFGLTGLQTALAFVTMARIIAEDVPTTRSLDVFYWLLIGTLLHLILPLRDLFKGDTDRRKENWELLIVTLQSGDGVLWGKWMSMISQMLICWLSILPYELLRYYIVEHEIMIELLGLTVLLVNGMVASLWGLLVSSLPAAGRYITALLMIPGVFLGNGFAFVGVATVIDRIGEPERLVSVGMIYLIVAGISFGLTAGRYDYDMQQPRGVAHLYLSDQDRQLMNAESQASRHA
ncbi:MAG: hypothetical protein JNM99_07315 [Verrucomicrobiaceae bacterium]|nr:hypothetical protein [Verrucomicrobiaceae bacterium]